MKSSYSKMLSEFMRIRILMRFYAVIKFFVNYTNKSSAVAEVGDRGDNRRGSKRGGAMPLSRRAGSPSNTMWPGPRSIRPYQVASLSIQPFPNNRHEPKTGGCAPFRGELRLHPTQRRLIRRLPPYQVAS